MQLDPDGRIISSGPGVGGLLAAWHSLAQLFTVELPRLVAALMRIGH